MLYLAGGVLLAFRLVIWTERAVEAIYYTDPAWQQRPVVPTELVDRARDAQQALEQATALVEDLQEETTVRQRILAELQREVALTQQVAELSKAQADAVAEVVSAGQRQELRRSFRGGIVSNVVVGLVFYVLGLLTDTFISTASLRDLLERSFNLG